MSKSLRTILALLLASAIVASLQGCATGAIGTVQSVDLSALAPSLPGAPGRLSVRALSADGSTAVGRFFILGPGRAESRHFIYRKAAGVEEIAALRGRDVERMTVSEDGAVVWGTFYDMTRGTYAGLFRWTPKGGLRDFGTFGRQALLSEGTSANGTFVVGHFSLPQTGPQAGPFHGFRFSEAGGFEDLGAMGDQSAFVAGISANGKLVTGYLRAAGQRYGSAFWRSDDGRVHAVGTQWGNFTVLSGISDDGRVAVGTYCSGGSDLLFIDCTTHALLYTPERGIQPLGLRNGGKLVGTPSISADGRTVSWAANEPGDKTRLYTGSLVDGNPGRDAAASAAP